jgi:predicted permease
MGHPAIRPMKESDVVEWATRHMMTWLKDNAFLAGWLALPLALFAIYAQNRGKELKDIDWAWVIIYATFGISFGITVTKGFDEKARSFAELLAFSTFFAIVWSRKTN